MMDPLIVGYVPEWVLDEEDRNGDPNEILKDCLHQIWVQARRLGYLSSHLDWTCEGKAREINRLYRSLSTALLDYDCWDVNDDEGGTVYWTTEDVRRKRAAAHYGKDARIVRDAAWDGIPNDTALVWCVSHPLGGVYVFEGTKDYALATFAGRDPGCELCRDVDGGWRVVARIRGEEVERCRRSRRPPWGCATTAPSAHSRMTNGGAVPSSAPRPARSGARCSANAPP